MVALLLTRKVVLEEEGATAVEYAVMLALILLMCIAAITTVGGETFNYWANNRSELEQAFQGQ